MGSMSHDEGIPGPSAGHINSGSALGQGFPGTLGAGTGIESPGKHSPAHAEEAVLLGPACEQRPGTFGEVIIHLNPSVC